MINFPFSSIFNSNLLLSNNSQHFLSLTQSILNSCNNCSFKATTTIQLVSQITKIITVFTLLHYFLIESTIYCITSLNINKHNALPACDNYLCFCTSTINPVSTFCAQHLIGHHSLPTIFTWIYLALNSSYYDLLTITTFKPLPPGASFQRLSLMSSMVLLITTRLSVCNILLITCLALFCNGIHNYCKE